MHTHTHTHTHFYICMYVYVLPGSPVGRESTYNTGDHLPVQELWEQSLGQEESLEMEMATHSSILAWEIPKTEDPRGLQTLGSQKFNTTYIYIYSSNLMTHCNKWEGLATLEHSLL